MSTREFSTDRAAATLSLVEEGALRGLASLPYEAPLADIAAFCAGFAKAEVSDQEAREALFVLDALGWAMPVGGIPTLDCTWRITEQGRIALERR